MNKRKLSLWDGYSLPIDGSTVDERTWVHVKTGDPLVTRRADSVPGRDSMVTTKYGTHRAGRWVRPAELAAALVNGATRGTSATNLARILNVTSPAGAAAVALSAPAPHVATLIALIIDRGLETTATTWRLAGTQVTALGGPKGATRRWCDIAIALTGLPDIVQVTPKLVSECVAAGLGLRATRKALLMRALEEEAAARESATDVDEQTRAGDKLPPLAS